MSAVFADAGYWIALLNPRDQLHTKAITVSNTLQGRSIVTSQMVLRELLNHCVALGQLFCQRAVQVVRSLQDDPDVEIVPHVTEKGRVFVLLQAASGIFVQRWKVTAKSYRHGLMAASFPGRL